MVNSGSVGIAHITQIANGLHKHDTCFIFFLIAREERATVDAKKRVESFRFSFWKQIEKNRM